MAKLFDRKEEIKSEEAVVPTLPIEPVKSQSEPLIITSDIDAYVLQRMREQPKTLEEVHLVKTYEVEGQHALKLPKDIEQTLVKRGMTPRWINKDKRAIDHALDNRGWVLVNRLLFPEIKRHNFTANGCIERGDAILGCMPIDRASALRKRPGERSLERMNNLPIEAYKADPNEEKYYKPDSFTEKDGETLTSTLDGRETTKRLGRESNEEAE